MPSRSSGRMFAIDFHVQNWTRKYCRPRKTCRYRVLSRTVEHFTAGPLSRGCSFDSKEGRHVLEVGIKTALKGESGSKRIDITSSKGAKDMKYGASLMLMFTTAMWCGAAENGQDKHIRESAAVLSEIMSARDKGIPEDLLEKAKCVGIIPNLKRAGFIVGAKYGKGVVTCRVNGG